MQQMRFLKGDFGMGGKWDFSFLILERTSRHIKKVSLRLSLKCYALVIFCIFVVWVGMTFGLSWCHIASLANSWTLGTWLHTDARLHSALLPERWGNFEAKQKDFGGLYRPGQNSPGKMMSSSASKRIRTEYTQWKIKMSGFFFLLKKWVGSDPSCSSDSNIITKAYHTRVESNLFFFLLVTEYMIFRKKGDGLGDPKPRETF